MAKSVLISIRPRWASLILSGEKTLEIRRTCPRLSPPFKCYIYCSKARRPWVRKDLPGIRQDGYILAEFMCDTITRLAHVGFTGIPSPVKLMAMDKNGFAKPAGTFNIDPSCMMLSEIERYLDGRDGFAWHISQLKIYDAPEQLSRFTRLQDTGFGAAPMPFKRAPQDWCYVEEGQI